MQQRSTFDRDGAKVANSARTIVATLCVLGLAGLMLFHTEPGNLFALDVPAVPARPGNEAQAFLHAPTGDPSLPSLDSLRSQEAPTPAETAPSTF